MSAHNMTVLIRKTTSKHGRYAAHRRRGCAWAFESAIGMHDIVLTMLRSHMHEPTCSSSTMSSQLQLNIVSSMTPAMAVSPGLRCTSNTSVEGWCTVTATVRPVLLMLRTARITMAAALASRPAYQTGLNAEQLTQARMPVIQHESPQQSGMPN